MAGVRHMHGCLVDSDAYIKSMYNAGSHKMTKHKILQTKCQNSPFAICRPARFQTSRSFPGVVLWGAVFDIRSFPTMRSIVHDCGSPAVTVSCSGTRWVIVRVWVVNRVCSIYQLVLNLFLSEWNLGFVPLHSLSPVSSHFAQVSMSTMW